MTDIVNALTHWRNTGDTSRLPEELADVLRFGRFRYSESAKQYAMVDRYRQHRADGIEVEDGYALVAAEFHVSVSYAAEVCRRAKRKPLD